MKLVFALIFLLSINSWSGVLEACGATAQKLCGSNPNDISQVFYCCDKYESKVSQACFEELTKFYEKELGMYFPDWKKNKNKANDNEIVEENKTE